MSKAAALDIRLTAFLGGELFWVLVVNAKRARTSLWKKRAVWVGKKWKSWLQKAKNTKKNKAWARISDFLFHLLFIGEEREVASLFGLVDNPPTRPVEVLDFYRGRVSAKHQNFSM